MEQERDLNAAELERMGKQYQTQKAQLDQLLASYKSKQMELDQLRTTASEDARRLSTELGKAQNESNLLIMEIKKYEGLVNFMSTEKNLILRSLQDARNLDPGLAARGLDMAERRMAELENTISGLKNEWSL